MVEQNGEINRYPISDLDITEDQVVMDDGHTLGSKLASEYATNDFVNERVKKAAPRNLLDNSDFTNPVNQRGQTTYTTTGYSIDRWYLWSANNDATLTINNGYISFNPGSNNGTLTQRISKGILDSTKTYTLAYLKTDGFLNIGYGSIHYNFDDECDLITLTSTSEGIVWAALYEGEYTMDTLPEYQPKGYGAELAECQRYHREDECVLVCKSTAGYFALGETYYLRDMGGNVPTVTLKKFTKPGVIDITSFSTDSLRIEHVGVGTYIVGFAELPSCLNYDIGILRFSINADI